MWTRGKTRLTDCGGVKDMVTGQNYKRVYATRTSVFNSHFSPPDWVALMISTKTILESESRLQLLPN